MAQPDFESAMHYALGRLERDLPPDYYYHSLQHTREDVVPAAERFAATEGVTGEALLLLRTAAYYHDVGYIRQRVDHEDCGVAIARDVLPDFGYSAEQIEIVGGMIMATKLPQTPHTLLEEILADADMDSIGRDDFLTTSLNLRSELAANGTLISEYEWYRRQLGFLQSHHYWTQAARSLRDAGKQQNIALLERLIAEYPDTDE
jgi:uncharacterized protein